MENRNDINNKIKNVSAKRNTLQKEVVTQAVLSSCDHPTADTIFERAKEKMPSIGLATVYRCLNTLIAEGKVREITVPNAPSRFDKTTKIHGHFLCRICGAVTDIKMDGIKAINEASKNNGILIDEAEIIFRGICEKCCTICGNTNILLPNKEINYEPVV